MTDSRNPLGRWRLDPSPLLGLTLIAAVVWAVAAIIDDDSPIAVLPAVATLALALVAWRIRLGSGVSRETPLHPPWLTPLVLAIAVAGALAGALLDDRFQGPGAGAAALVMAGPAAMLAAIPLAFRTGSSQAGSAGATFSALETVQAASRISTLIVPKDRTLTTGDLRVTAVDPVEPDHDRNLRWFAGALEKASDHRVGRAIAKLAARGTLADVVAVPGRGISGSVDRHPVRVGSPDWLGFTAEPTIWTTVGVEVDGRLIGTLTVADEVRPELTRDLDRLRRLGIDLVVVSPDSPERTAVAAEAAGITDVHAGYGDRETAALAEELARQGHRVGVVGISRPPHPTIGFTDPAAGADHAGGATVIVGDLSPARLAEALGIARSTTTRIRRAEVTATVLGLLGALAGATGLFGPITAAVSALTGFLVVAVVARRG